MKKEFLNYIHLFRGLSILFIVIGHFIHLFSWEINPFFEKLMFNFIKNGTVMFIIISGFLFQYLSSKFNYKQFIFKKIKFIFLPYLISSTPFLGYFFLTRFLKQSEPTLILFKKVFLYILIGNHLNSYWYIPMIVLVFLISPIILQVVNWKHFTKILPFLLLGSSIIHRPWNSSNPFHSLLYFLPVFMFGMIMCKFRKNVMSMLNNNILFVWIGFVVLLLIQTCFYEISGNIHIHALRDVFSVPVDVLLFQKIFLTLLFFHYLQLAKEKSQKILSFFADISFGIFFLHPYIFYHFDQIFEDGFFEVNSTLTFFLSWVIIIGLVVTTSLLVVLCKKILGNKSKFIIGC